MKLEKNVERELTPPKQGEQREGDWGHQNLEVEERLCRVGPQPLEDGALLVALKAGIKPHSGTNKKEPGYQGQLCVLR